MCGHTNRLACYGSQFQESEGKTSRRRGPLNSIHLVNLQSQILAGDLVSYGQHNYDNYHSELFIDFKNMANSNDSRDLFTLVLTEHH